MLAAAPATFPEDRPCRAPPMMFCVESMNELTYGSWLIELNDNPNDVSTWDAPSMLANAWYTQLQVGYFSK